MRGSSDEVLASGSTVGMDASGSGLVLMVVFCVRVVDLVGHARSCCGGDETDR